MEDFTILVTSSHGRVLYTAAPFQSSDLISFSDIRSLAFSLVFYTREHV